MYNINICNIISIILWLLIKKNYKKFTLIIMFNALTSAKLLLAVSIDMCLFILCKRLNLALVKLNLTM